MDRVCGSFHPRLPAVVLLTALQHGIEYGYVGGDPAELMRICVENGTFTLAFMKEGLLKVFIALRCALKESNIHYAM